MCSNELGFFRLISYCIRICLDELAVCTDELGICLDENSIFDE